MQGEDVQQWHSFVDQDAVHILQRHIPSPQTTLARLDVFAALQRKLAQHTGRQSSVIDVSRPPYQIDTQSRSAIFAINDWYTDDIEKILISTIPTALHGRIQSWISPEDLRTYPSSFHDQLVPAIPININGFRCEVLPPSPFHAPLYGFIDKYMTLYPNLKTLLPLLNIWATSHGIPATELSANCLSLLMIAFLQYEYKLPALEKGRCGVLWPIRVPVGSIIGRRGLSRAELRLLCDWCDLELVAPKTLPVGHTGTYRLYKAPLAAVLVGFFKFCVNLVPSETIVSARWPPLLPRNLLENRASTEIGHLRPSAWKDDVLVVTDPFLRTHNHAHWVSRGTWTRFLGACNGSVDRLTEMAPIHTIFGPVLEVFPLNPGPVTLLDHHRISWSIHHMMDARNPAFMTQKRHLTRTTVEEAIKYRFGAGYSVACFGSTVYGVDSPTSDLDMVIMDSNMPLGFHPSIRQALLPAASNMWEVKTALQQAGFTHVVAISGATVPIVKFFDPQTQINVDLNFNNRLGAINTDLLKAYCDLWPPLRSMIVFVKKWAHSISLNDPSGVTGPASFSSYCLTLMTVAYLQVAGVLPNLQVSAVGNVDRDRHGFWFLLKNDERVWCDTRYEKTFRAGAVPLSIDQAIYGWFRFFAYRFQYSQHVLDIKRGGFSPRQRPINIPQRRSAQHGNMTVSAEVTTGTVEVTREFERMALNSSEPSEWAQSWLVVVDPFIRVKNNASGCNHRVQERFQQECRRAVSLLEAGELIEVLFGLRGPLFHGTDGQPLRPGRAPRPVARLRAGQARLASDSPWSGRG